MKNKFGNFQDWYHREGKMGQVPKNGGISIIQRDKAISVFLNTYMPKILFQG